MTAWIEVTCFIQYVAVQPGTTTRSGYPFQCGSAAPFISYASIVFSSTAFHTGTLFTKSGVLSITGPSAPSNIDAQTLAKAEAALAKYIGAVAKIVVKRAAAKARDAGELYLLIAEEIEDKNERKTFIRKAISASGKE